MLPEGAPEAFAERSALWNAVEAAEGRSDARVAREVQVSLPHELSAEQRQELVRALVQSAYCDKGMNADVERRSAVEGQRVSVRVTLGLPGKIEKKKQKLSKE